MIIKKLLVPFINEKILANAEHCSIAVAAISEPAFDFLMSKLPPKCKVDIVTGLDLPTDPNVLSKALEKYPNRVNFRIHTKSAFHSNVYIFDLPFRKMVAFIGSANFTLGGFKDNEELSYKTDTEKGVEEVKTWFRSYFEYAEDLTEAIITQYQEIYPSAIEREAQSNSEKREFIESVSGSFTWETANLKDQYFQEENYLTFENRKAALNTQLVLFERERVQSKLLNLGEQLKPFMLKLKVHQHYDSRHIVSSMDPVFHYENRIKGMWLAYGRGKKELEEYKSQPQDMIYISIIIRRNDFGIWLMPGKQNSGRQDREYFRNEMKSEEYKAKFFTMLKSLGEDYWIDVAGDKQKVSSFKTADQLLESTEKDSLNYSFTIGRTYIPNHPDISSANILTTIQTEFMKLYPLYLKMKEQID